MHICPCETRRARGDAASLVGALAGGRASLGAVAEDAVAALDIRRTERRVRAGVGDGSPASATTGEGREGERNESETREGTREGGG